MIWIVVTLHASIEHGDTENGHGRQLDNCSSIVLPEPTIGFVTGDIEEEDDTDEDVEDGSFLALIELSHAMRQYGTVE